MLLIVFICTCLVVVTGITSIGIAKDNNIFKYLAPALYTFTSIAALVYVISQFSKITNVTATLNLPSSVPLGLFTMGIDSLSGFFLIPLLILTASCSLYGTRYFKGHSPGMMHWFFYAMLIGGMFLVLLARNAVFFIIAWEIISFASFLLVISNAKKPSARRAAWIYLVSAHVGTVFLLLTFFLLAAPVNSFEFSAFASAHYSNFQLCLIYVCGLIAFGMKAGFIPLHIWLPLAHPEAPSHVSAIMSGIMIKMGIYAIFRLMIMTNSYPAWWGVLLIILGGVSGIVGVLFAIGEHNIKRLLAYHSVENIGIILLGMGIGVLGVAYHYPMVAVFGFAGALLHVVNHSIFKALLFLGAGAIIRQTDSDNIDSLGGLIKKMPWTGTLFLLGSISITGLPFFNGFISELFIYAAAIIGTVKSNDAVFPMLTASVVVSLALIGALACACFAKVFGIIFLGSPRDRELPNIKEVPVSMRSGMFFLGTFIIFIGMCSVVVMPFLIKPLQQLVKTSNLKLFASLAVYSEKVTIMLACALATIVGLLIFRHVILKSKSVISDTWGCGYSKPDESMQYTASSFAEPFTDTFNTVLNLNTKKDFDKAIFPVTKWRFASHTNDWILNGIFIPTIKFIDKILELLRWIQNGKVGVYILYIIAVLTGLIAWMFLIWK